MTHPLELKMGHGALKMNPVHRFIHRKIFRGQLIRGIPFDWNVGYDVRDIVGSISIKNQGSNDSCSGQSGSYAVEILRRLKGIKEGDISARSIYAPIAYPGGGTTIFSLERQLCKKGANLESAVPSYDVFSNPLSEAQMEDLSWENQTLIIDALNRAGYTSFDVGTNIDDVASNIKENGFCIMEICGQNNGTWQSAYPLPPSKLNTNELWYHFMVLIGAKMINGQKQIIGLQSMGSSWGDNGVQYFSDNYFNSGYIEDVFTFLNNVVTKPIQENEFESFLEWFRSFWVSSSTIISPAH